MSTNVKANDTTPAGEALLGRTINAAGEPIDGLGPLGNLAWLPIDRPAPAGQRWPADQMLQSGIKVIDLFAPIVRGGSIPLIAVSGVGMIVNSMELIHNIATRQGGCAVIGDLDGPGFSIKELLGELRSAGVDQHTAMIAGQYDDPPDVMRRTALAALTLAEYFAGQGRETLLFLDEHLVLPATIERLLGRQHGAQAAVTLFVWQVRAPETFDPQAVLSQSLFAPDGQLVFSPALAKQKIWPAVNPLASGSRLLGEQRVSAEHGRVAQASKELLAGYSILAEGSPGDDPALQARARKILLFQMQPFAVAETFTGMPGEYVPLEETLRGFGEIVDGRHDEVDEAAFRFTGTLGQVLARSKTGDRG